MREMKDSGVAWIGAVPSDYRTASIGSLFTIKKDIIGQEPETVLSITQTGIRPKDLSSNEGQNASSYAHYQIVNVGDFAMNHMDLLTGWIDISKYEGVTSPDYRVFTLNDKEMSADYFLRVFQYYYTNKVFFGFGQGVATLGRWRLPAINFKKIDVPVPPILEQQRIVAVIDENIGKVDALIANVQAQIEKLKAYKQSVITEVVTKGLDPTVPMKDSGVEWIGEMPEHYKVAKIKKVCANKISDGTHSTPEYASEDDGFPFLSSKDVRNGYINWADIKYITLETHEQIKRNITPKVGDVLLSKNGSIGFSAVVEDDREFDIYVTLALLRPNSLILSKYLKYALDCDTTQKQFSLHLIGIGVPNLHLHVIQDTKILLPPVEEQQGIVTHLDEKCIQIDRLIAIKQAKIEKLEQYKRSLIYEYVTGKREVV